MYRIEIDERYFYRAPQRKTPEICPAGDITALGWENIGLYIG